MTARTERGRSAERDGRRAERQAAGWLRLKGYVILARRWRSSAGEVDIVARRLFGPVCFVEVKTRADDAAAVAAVSLRQRARIARAAEIFLNGRALARTARFDVISIVPGRLPRHIPDAWRPDDR